MSVITWTDLRDGDAVGSFLRTHGPAPFNHLTDSGIDAQRRRIAAGVLECTAGLVDGEVVALATVSQFSAAALTGTPYLRLSGHYIEEVAVHAGHRGRGVGVGLLRQVVDRYRQPVDIYIDCDERNTACARMIVKAGFGQVSRYRDPDRGPARQTLLFRFREQA
jgi:GNAT superfamily N-acetyltransferase